MARYVDGFLLPVPEARLDEYRRLAELAGAVWREHGALDYVECVAEDVEPGKRTSFPRSVELQPGETVVFAWIAYRSRQHRDEVNARVMADPRIASMKDQGVPFDAERMIWGGFEVLVGA